MSRGSLTAHPELFATWQSHKDVAAGRDVPSAGFVDLKTMTCYGESESLEVKSDPERDTRLLRMVLGGLNDGQ